MKSPMKRSKTLRLLVDNEGGGGSSSNMASPTSTLSSNENSPVPKPKLQHRNTIGSTSFSSGSSGSKKSRGRLSMLKNMAKLTISNKRNEQIRDDNNKENDKFALQIEAPKTDNTYNENLTIKKKKMHWGCLICLNRHNHISLTACSTCGHFRPCNRFGHRDSQGRFYLCIADTSTVIPTLSLYRVSNNPDSSENCHRATKILMYHTSNILSECVTAAFEAWEKDGNNDDGSSVESAGTHSSLGSYHERRSRLSGSEEGQWERDPTKTLYDQVLTNANSIAYDPSIGRYMDKELAAQSPVKLHENMAYGKTMQNTYKELQKQVQEVKSRREDSEAKRFLNDFQPPLKDEPRTNCGLCELELPLSQLLGRITFKAISYWKQQRGAPISANDVRMTSTKVFNATPICLFCTQYFDEDFGSNVVDKTAIQEQLGFNRRHSFSKQQNFSNKAYKKILSNFLDTNSALVQERPLSRMKREIAMKQLRMRGEAADPSLRYQFNPQVQDTRFIDRDKDGSFLRSKYRDLGALVSEQRKGEWEEGTSRQAAVKQGAAVDKKPLFDANNGGSNPVRRGGGDDRSVGSKMSSSSTTSSTRRSRNRLKSSRNKSAPAKLRRSAGSAASASDVSVASCTASRKVYKRSSSHNGKVNKGVTISKRNSASAQSALKGRKLQASHNSSMRSEASSVHTYSSARSGMSKVSSTSKVAIRRAAGVLGRRRAAKKTLARRRPMLQPLAEAPKRGIKAAAPVPAEQPLTFKSKIIRKIAMTASVYDSAASSSSAANGPLAVWAKPPAPVVLCSSIVQGAAPAGSKQLSKQLQLQGGGGRVLRGHMKIAAAGANGDVPLKGPPSVSRGSPRGPKQQQQQERRDEEEEEEEEDGPSPLARRLRGHSGDALLRKQQQLLEEEEEEEEGYGEEESEPEELYKREGEQGGDAVADLSLEEYLSSQPLPTDPPCLSVFKEDASFDTYGDDNTFPSLGEGEEDDDDCADVGGVAQGPGVVRKALLLWGRECIEVAVSDEKLIEPGGEEGGILSFEAYNWATQGVISSAHCQENFFAPPPQVSRAVLGDRQPGAAMALLSGGSPGRNRRASRLNRDTRPAGPAIKLLSRGHGKAAPAGVSNKYRARAHDKDAARVNQMKLISDGGGAENVLNGGASHFSLHDEGDYE